MSAPASSSRAPLHSPVEWDAYVAAVRQLESRICLTPPGLKTLEAVQHRAAQRLIHLRRFLATVGDPQTGLPVVHVTGTSGKGSTAVAIAGMLTATGLRVGLATSPYLQVATEKVQIDGILASGTDLAALASWLDREETRWMQDTAEPPLTYSEAWTALTLHWFANSNLDLAVIEVGAGGRLDPTNVVEPVASVVTNIGFDHMESLGPSLRDIAWQKAGIIKPGAMALTGEQQPDLIRIIADAAREAGTELHLVNASGPAAPHSGMDAIRANRMLAQATVEALAERGFGEASRLDAAWQTSARLPGRVEWMPTPNGPAVMLDGAHNADKFAALRGVVACEMTRLALPAPVVIGGVLGSKDVSSFGSIIAAGVALVATTAATIGKPGSEPDAMARLARSQGFAGDIFVEPVPERAMATALELASARGTWVLGTGSLYLVGQLRRRWYPDRAIAEARSPWPQAPAIAGCEVARTADLPR